MNTILDSKTRIGCVNAPIHKEFNARTLRGRSNTKPRMYIELHVHRFCKDFFTKTLLKIEKSGLVRDMLMKLSDNSFVIILVLWAILSGLLLVHISDLQTQNNTLEIQTSDYQNQIEQLENQIDDLEQQVYQKKLSAARQVKISGIELGPGKTESLFVDYFDIYVAITNYGPNSVVGLVVSTGSYNNGEQPSDREPIELLKAGETATVTLHGSDVWGSRTEGVSLWFNDVAIDSKSIDY